MTRGRSTVLLDPFPLWLEAVGAVLARIDFKVATSTTSAEAALEAVAALQPDLLVLDTEPYRDGDGLACLRRARTLCRHVRCIALSRSDDPVAIESALGAGAVAYVLKTARPEDLASAVRQAFEPSVYFTPPTMESRTQAVSPVQPDLLTPRELEILTLLASGSPNGAIASNLRVSNRTEAARWAHPHGVVTPPPQPPAQRRLVADRSLDSRDPVLPEFRS